MRQIKKIIIHCSGSDEPKDDSIEAIRNLHVSSPNIEFKFGEYKTFGRGWSDIGYHFYINSYGKMSHGRPIHVVGAHCLNQNVDSIGICLGGNHSFSKEQFETARVVIAELCRQFGLGNDQVFGHCHFDKVKTCPNFNIEEVFAF